MKSQKIVLIACILISAILFIDGLSVLATINRQEHEKYHSDSEQNGYTQNNSMQDSGMQNIGTYFSHEESSIMQEMPVNLLILGLDEEEERSDVIVLLNYSPDLGRLNLLSIARDTRVYVKGEAVKINALMGMGGEQMIADMVENITGLDVNYYITLNFAGFRKMIDTLGGVSIDVPFNMNYDDPDQNLHIHLREGSQVLDGNKAEQFVRYRKGNKQGEGYSEGDIGRIKMQQEFMKALIRQKLKLKYLSKADDIFSILKQYMRTNIEISDVRHYLKNIKNIDYNGVEAYTIPGDAAYIDDLWYFIYDRNKMREIVKNNFFR